MLESNNIVEGETLVRESEMSEKANMKTANTAAAVIAHSFFAHFRHHVIKLPKLWFAIFEIGSTELKELDKSWDRIAKN